MARTSLQNSSARRKESTDDKKDACGDHLDRRGGDHGDAGGTAQGTARGADGYGSRRVRGGDYGGRAAVCRGVTERAAGADRPVRQRGVYCYT